MATKQKARKKAKCAAPKRTKRKPAAKKKKAVAKRVATPDAVASKAKKPAPKKRATRKKLPTCKPKAVKKKPKPKPKPVVVAPKKSAYSPLAFYSGPWTRAKAERLLWRAGFGPTPGQLEQVVAMGLEAAVLSLTRAGPASLTGPAPTDGANPLDRDNGSGHHVLWWLDRMVRSSNQLEERMTLVWHDWFATNEAQIDQTLMNGQNDLFRRQALGSFRSLLHDVTMDPAMILWLNADQNRRNAVNENYAREVMELFSLGANRGAYSEADIRELARCLSGWTKDVVNNNYTNFRWAQARWDPGVKTVFAGQPNAQSGAFTWEDAVRMLIDHPKHPSWLVTRLWSYFIPTPPSPSDQAVLEHLYWTSGNQVRPLLEAILLHPDLHAGPPMVKPPAVYAAGLLRSFGRGVDTSEWVSLLNDAGQRLFRPPDVGGWDENGWLDTSTTRGRWFCARRVLNGRHFTGAEANAYDKAEDAAAAVARAHAAWNYPSLTAETSAELGDFAKTCLPAVMTAAQQSTYRAYRQNALRQLIGASPDLQVS